MFGRRGFFGALAACFAWILPSKRAEPVPYCPPGSQSIADSDGNCVFGYESGVEAGLKNVVIVGEGSIAKKSNVVILGNEKTESLILGPWELLFDDDGPHFVNRITGRKYRMREVYPVGKNGP